MKIETIFTREMEREKKVSNFKFNNKNTKWENENRKKEMKMKEKSLNNFLWLESRDFFLRCEHENGSEIRFQVSQISNDDERERQRISALNFRFVLRIYIFCYSHRCIK